MPKRRASISLQFRRLGHRFIANSKNIMPKDLPMKDAARRPCTMVSRTIPPPRPSLSPSTRLLPHCELDNAQHGADLFGSGRSGEDFHTRIMNPTNDGVGAPGGPRGRYRRSGGLPPVVRRSTMPSSPWPALGDNDCLHPSRWRHLHPVCPYAASLGSA